VGDLPEVCPEQPTGQAITDPNLARLVMAWASLNPAIRAAILALLGAAMEEEARAE
jgi:hypothetical protein